MPKLVEFVRGNADLADRFAVVGVHQMGPASLDDVRRRVAARAAEMDRSLEVLPATILDSDERATFTNYGPQGLGDMFLLDSDGVVVAVGDSAFDAVRGQMDDLRRRIANLVAALGSTKVAAEAGESVGDLYDLGASKADEAVQRWVDACPIALAGAAYEAMVVRGLTDAVVAALRQKDAKRRRVALDVMLAHPSEAWVAPALEFAGEKGRSSEDVCRGLRVACASGPAMPEVRSRVLDASRRGEIPVRTCCMELLARIDAPEARERLLAALATDSGRAVRLAAVTALAALGGEDVAAALRRAAAEDKVDAVRAAAQKALDGLGKPAVPPPAK